MARTYSITRESAASALWISTRTIDRYIKSWKLSYKKVANKVLLAKEEIDELKDDFDVLHQEDSSEVVSTSNSWVTISNSSLERSVEEKVDKFMLIIREKDAQIEDKNKTLFLLQQRIWELEEKLKTMVALPDYTREKQEALIEKQKLEEKIASLKEKIRAEKVKNIIFISISLLLIIVAIFVFLSHN